MRVAKREREEGGRRVRREIGIERGKGEKRKRERERVGYDELIDQLMKFIVRP